MNRVKPIFSSIWLFLSIGINLLGQPEELQAINKQVLVSLNDQNMVLDEAIELHLTSAAQPVNNSTVRLNHPDAWLFFDNVPPETVLTKYASSVLIGDQTFQSGINGRIAIYRHGTVIMPHGEGFQPLEVFTGSGFSGKNQLFSVQTYYKQLDSIDNAIQSFKLKRGYMATLATNPDGTGYSRVFTANDEDLEVAELQAELKNKVSFIRVFKYNWVSKKGWCDTGTKAKNTAAMVGATWYYSWSADQVGTNNIEYVPIKQKGDWPGWSEINNKTDVSQLLGYNEPDQVKQANLSLEYALSQWPEYLKSGLRIGSLVPSDAFNSWGFFSFVDQCKALNYRIDFAVVHAYWAKTPQKWYDDLKYIHERTGLPIWITEWNNGANWTTEWWPGDWAAQQQKQLNDLKAILNVLDTAHFVERYSIYNWVEDKRAIILNNQLTPAGEYYTNNLPQVAFRRVNEVIPAWKTIGAKLSLSVRTDGTINLTWTDPYAEMNDHYEIEQKSGSSVYSVIGTLQVQSDLNFELRPDQIYGQGLTFRIKTIGTNKTAAWSNEVVYTQTTGADTLQAGQFSLNDISWQNCRFSETFKESPVAILGPVSYNNPTLPLTSRIKNIQADVLNFHIEPWSYLSSQTLTNSETVSLLAVLPGHHHFGELTAEASTVSGVTNQWKQVSFSQSFSVIPAVFVSQNTSNQSIPTTVRIRNITPAGFEICLLKEEAITQTLFGDKVGYLAIEPGRGAVNGKRIMVQIGTEQEIGGYFQYKEIEADPTYSQPVVFANLQTVNDAITSTLRWIKGSSANRFKVFKHREMSASSDPVYRDQLAWMIIDLAPDQPVSSRQIQESAQITVSPNPAGDMLFLNTNQPCKIELFDLSGRKRIDQVVSHSIDISSLSRGIYFLKVNCGPVTRLIKQ